MGAERGSGLQETSGDGSYRGRARGRESSSPGRVRERGRERGRGLQGMSGARVRAENGEEARGRLSYTEKLDGIRKQVYTG